MKKTLLLVDDHKVIMDGLELFINNIQGFKVIGRALTGKEAVEKVKALRPDAVLLDHNLPDCDGIGLIPELLHIDKELKIIILTSFEEPLLAIQAIKAGAKSFLTKHIDEKGLENVLNGVFEDEKVWLDPILTYDVITSINTAGHKENADFLTEQEKRMVVLVAQGKTNKDIAEQLYLTEQTVKNYLFRTYKKLGLRNRAEVASFAIKHKFI